MAFHPMLMFNVEGGLGSLVRNHPSSLVRVIPNLSASLS